MIAMEPTGYGQTQEILNESQPPIPGLSKAFDKSLQVVGWNMESLRGGMP